MSDTQIVSPDIQYMQSLELDWFVTNQVRNAIRQKPPTRAPHTAFVLSHGTLSDDPRQLNTRECELRTEFTIKQICNLPRANRLPNLVLCGATQQLHLMQQHAVGFISSLTAEPVANVILLDCQAWPACNTKTQFQAIVVYMQETNIEIQRSWVISSDYHARCELYYRLWVPDEIKPYLRLVYMPWVSSPFSRLTQKEREALVDGEKTRIPTYMGKDLAKPWAGDPLLDV